jgi:hypothetical protein
MSGCRKKSKILQLVVILIGMLFLAPGLLFAHDEDPAAIAKRKTAITKFFNENACLDCHGSTAKYNLLWAREGYSHSGHKNGGNAFYANGEECQRCHTNEGFIKYTTTGMIDEKSYIEHPSQPGCFTCHDPHNTGDLSLRTVKPVTLSNGKTFNIGKGNLCANCHQTRGTAQELVKALPANKLAGYWGAHHGPQSDMLIGNNAYEYPGKTYYSSVHATLVKDGCAECHMSYPKQRFGFSPAMSGHSFSIEGEVHHAPKLNNSGCLGNCHSKVGQVMAPNPDTPKDSDTFWWHQTDAVFDIEAKADFDHDGKVEPLQSEIEGLLDMINNSVGTGLLQKGELPIFKKNGGFNWTRSQKMRSLEEVAALYNYKFVLEDRSRGIHNAPYAIQILYDTIASLDPSFDVSMRNVIKPPEKK